VAVTLVAVLVGLRALPDGGTFKGMVEQTVAPTLGIEVLERQQGRPGRIMPVVLDHGQLGLPLPRESALLPVVQSPELPLDAHPWFTTLVVAANDGPYEVLQRSAQAQAVRPVPDRGHVYALAQPFEVGGTLKAGAYRLFIVLTEAPVSEEAVQRALETMRPDAAGEERLLPALAAGPGIEGAVWVVLR